MGIREPNIEDCTTQGAAEAASGLSTDLTGRRLAGGRLEVRRPLGAGGMGRVYEAYDRQLGARVALKTLNRLSAAGVYRIKNEFRSLADVTHQNLVQLLELFCEDDLWFFTMRLVRGRSFADFARVTLQRSEGSFDQVMAAFEQLVQGVRAIHGAGKLHRDLKPSNVLVDDAGRVVVLDFGLVSDMHAGGVGQTVGTSIVGTPQYIAPEVLVGGEPSQASDVYALGVVLYEALTGILPRYSEAERSRWPMGARPLPPAAIAPAVPQPWSELCMRLLAADPGGRPDLTSVAAELEEVAARGSRPPPAPAHAPSSFVGRQGELDALTRALNEVEAGRGVALFVSGPSGIGKTRLIDHFSELVEAELGAVVLRGRCYERESVPFKTLDSAIDSLSRYWRGLGSADASALLPRDTRALVRLFPVLERVDVLRNAPGSGQRIEDPQEQRVRGFRALKDVLARLGDRRHLVLAIDDLQWADAEGAQELVTLLAPPDAPRLLLLGSHRESSAGRAAPLAALTGGLGRVGIEVRRLPLEALPEADAQQLVRRALGGAADQARAAKIVRDAEGNPLFISELAQAQAREDSRDLTLDELLLERIRRLPDEAQRLLALLAIANVPQAHAVLLAAVGDAARLENALQLLKRHKLARADGLGSGDRVGVFHDRIREVLVGALSAQEVAALHATLADALAAQQDPDAEALAGHLLRAGETTRAAVWFEHAAARAVEALAFDHAAFLYGRALELGEHDARTASFIGARHAETLALAGQPLDAADAYERAARGAQGRQRNELLLSAAEQLLFAGHNERAVALLRDTLPAYDLAMPASRGALLRTLLYSNLRLMWTRPRSAPEGDPVQADLRARRAEICATFGDATLYMDFGLYAYFQTQHVLLGLVSHDDSRVALALTTRSMLRVSPNPASFDAVQGDLEQARALAERSGDPRVVARVTLNRAVVFSAAGRYEETLALAEQAERIFREQCRGQTWGLRLSILWQSVSLFYLGEFARLRALCDEHLPEAERRQDRNLTKLLRMWRTWCALADDDYATALEVAPESAEPDSHFTILDAAVMVLRATLHLYADEPAEARDVYERAQKAAQASGVLRARTRGYEVRWTRGLTAVHGMLRDLPGAKRRARTDARALERAGTEDALAMAASLRAGIAAARGDRDTAVRKLEEAERHFAARKMQVFALTARLRRAQLAQQHDQLAELTDALRARGIHTVSRWLQLWHPVDADAAE